MTSSRILGSLLLACALLGGCGTRRNEDAASRVTPALRAACPLETDGFIASRILVFEGIRDEGLTRLEALTLFMGQACDQGMDDILELSGGDQNAAWEYYNYCSTCNAAIIEFVYH